MPKISSIRLVLTFAGLVAGLTVAQALLLPPSLVLAQSGNRAITIAQPAKSQHTGTDQRVALIIGNGSTKRGILCGIHPTMPWMWRQPSEN